MCRINNRRETITTLLLLLAVTLATAWLVPVSQWPMALLLGWTLLLLALIDSRTLLLPDQLTLSLMWFGLLGCTAGLLPSLTLPQAVYGAAGGYGTLWLVSRGYLLLRKKEGLGLGDAKLLAALGAWTGAEWLPWIVLYATLIAAAVMLPGWLTTRRALDKPFPFGPALALSGWIIFLWQQG